MISTGPPYSSKHPSEDREVDKQHFSASVTPANPFFWGGGGIFQYPDVQGMPQPN